MTLFKTCSWNFDLSINMSLVNGGYLHYKDMKKFFKNILLWNRWSDFEIISQKCSSGDPSQKLYAKFWAVNKHGSVEWGLLASYGYEVILKKISCFESAGQILKQFRRNCPWIIIFIHSRNFDPSTNMALVKGKYLHYMDKKKISETAKKETLAMVLSCERSRAILALLLKMLWL